MGFFSWLLCSILVVALVLLLFPFSVRIEFEAGERGARALFFFFKKKVYEAKKNWGKNIDDKCVDRESRPSSLGHDRDQHLGQERSDCPKTKDERRENVEKSDDAQSRVTAPVKSETKEPEKKCETEVVHDNKSDVILEEGERRPIESKSEDTVEAVAKHPEETTTEKKAMDPVESEPLQGDKNDVAESETAKTDEPAARSVPEEKKTADVKDDAKAESAKSEKKPKKEKRKLSDREFWTILLTPDLDARAFRYVLKILGAVFSLFRIRFSDCYVEGIRTDYQTMGYIAAVNGFLKAYPYVGDWDLQMDWSHEKELHAAGNVRLSITLLRIFCFVLETLVLAGILAFIFWRRRARVIKTNELPELGFVRKKILNIILED